MIEVGAGAGVVFVVDVDVSVVRAGTRKWRIGSRKVRVQEGGYLLGISDFGEGGAEVGAVLMALLGFPFFIFFSSFFFFVGSGSDDIVAGRGGRFLVG